MFKITVSEEVEGMDFMGLVENPAHMKSFITFNQDTEKPEKSYFLNDDQQIIMGVAIATDMPIYRKDPDGKEYNVFFDKENTRKIGQKMLSHMHLHNVNLQHNENNVVSDIQLDTIFYVDKARGVHVPDVFKDQNLRDGSMIISYKVHGKDNWSQIKKDAQEGKINGFSIEGWFDMLEVNFKKKAEQKEKQNKMKKPTFWERVYGKLKQDEDKDEVVFGEAETTEGVIIKWEGDLAIDSAVFIMDEEGNQLQAPEGNYTIMNEDGTSRVLIVDANGIVTDIENVEVVEDVAAEEVAEVMQKMKADFDAQFKTQSDKFAALEKENKTLKKENETQKTHLEKLVKELDERGVEKKEPEIKDEKDEAKDAYRKLINEKK